MVRNIVNKKEIILWLMMASLRENHFKITTFQFVAHPNVQQLLASIWYEGLPGFRQKNMILQVNTTSTLMVSNILQFYYFRV